MTKSNLSLKTNIDDLIINEIHAHPDWIKRTKNVSLIIIAIGIIIVNILNGDITKAIIRVFIYVIVALIISRKAEIIFDITICIYQSGQIIIKKWPRKRVVTSVTGGTSQTIKLKRNWLIGPNKVKVPIRAFPDLEKQLTRVNGNRP